MSAGDGAHWRQVPVIKLFGRSFAVLTNPSKPGSVSLRAKAVDVHGNSVTETITRAHRVK